MSALDLVVLHLVGRHPFLSVDTLAAVLGREVHWVRARPAALTSRGLMRVLTAEEVSPSELAEQELLELTGSGLEVPAAHLGLSLGWRCACMGWLAADPTIQSVSMRTAPQTSRSCFIHFG